LTIGRAARPGDLARLLAPAGAELVIVAGSTHADEELQVIEAARAVPGARLILVPRHPRRCPELALELARAGTSVQRLSALRAGHETPRPELPVLVDTIGELEAVYALADLVFVGGSLVPHGGQNVLEPAAQGIAVAFGPHMSNFSQEAKLLLEAGAACQVADRLELARRWRELSSDPSRRQRMADAGRAAVQSQQGATALTLEALSRLCLAELAS
jgi:3-deoxy-D-manno-octulosonic-acid transferase